MLSMLLRLMCDWNTWMEKYYWTVSTCAWWVSIFWERIPSFCCLLYLWELCYNSLNVDYRRRSNPTWPSLNKVHWKICWKSHVTDRGSPCNAGCKTHRYKRSSSLVLAWSTHSPKQPIRNLHLYMIQNIRKVTFVNEENVGLLTFFTLQRLLYVYSLSIIHAE